MWQKILLRGSIDFLHNFFTVVWIGGLIFIIFTLLPTLKQSFQKDPKSKEFMKNITIKHSLFVYISIVGLFVTGVLLGKSNPAYLGFMSFGNAYTILASVKHILTFIMVAISVFRSVAFGRKAANLSPNQNKMGMLLIFINLILGIVILALSSYMSVL